MFYIKPEDSYKNNQAKNHHQAKNPHQAKNHHQARNLLVLQLQQQVQDLLLEIHQVLPVIVAWELELAVELVEQV
jgi:hypothetical protein